jgi:2-desacetyl-2-hydroxyethyl bacteriochlorophyllide A dehydrogenase
MKVMILNEYNHPLEVVERDIPRVQHDEILLKVKALGICQTDIKITKGAIPASIVTLPHVLGHEVVGEVTEVGDHVSGVKAGDVGIVYPYVTCRECEPCLTGRGNLCVNLKRIGFELDGGFSEFLRIPAHSFCPFDQCLPAHEMAIVADAIGTSYHAITGLAGVKPGQDVLIVGAGGLGIHAVQIAKLCGANVFVVDMDSQALDLARQFGADQSFLPAEAPQAIKELTDGRGVHAVIEVVGSPETLSWSLPALKSGGKLILVGYAPGNPFALDTMLMHYREYEIIGCRFIPKAELLELIRLIEKGKVKPVVTQTFPFDQANEALAVLREGKNLGRIGLILD